MTVSDENKNELNGRENLIRIVKEEDLPKLKRAGIKFGVQRKNGMVAISFKSELKAKVEAALNSHKLKR